MSKHEARQRGIEVLRSVGIPKPERRIDEYSFELSGGLRQRAMIAMALSCNPRLLIADEPTTALDVTTQAQILDLLRKIQQERQMAIMLITHDLGVVAEMADDVVVMYLGRVVEEGPVDAIFHDAEAPVHQGAAAVDPEHRLGATGEAADDHRLDSPPVQPSARLPVPSPVHGVHARPLRQGRPAAAGRRGRSQGELLPLPMTGNARA